MPVIEGTLIRLQVTRPGGRAAPRPMWLWASAPGPGEDLVAVLWQAYLRRFDIEHTFRFLKQQLGWTRPLLRDPAAADLWTWLLVAAYAQLHLTRDLVADARLPWQPRRPPGRRGDDPGPGPRRVSPRPRMAGTPASAAKPASPGPGRPKGSKNKRKAPRQPVGKRQPKTRNPADKPQKRTKQTG